MDAKTNQSLRPCGNGQVQDTKKGYTKELFEILYKRPLSRRMAATELGFNDQTYMVTPFVLEWIKQGRAAVVGVIKCSRSGRLVEAITTNPDLFPQSRQLKLF
jgi:hypothetical protein